MRNIVLTIALSICFGCEVSFETGHYHDAGSAVCDTAPYGWRAEEYYDYYDHHGWHEGTCGTWYVGSGWYEEWCNWHDTCGWDLVEEYRLHYHY